jgi:hypothetical protein
MEGGLDLELVKCGSTNWERGISRRILGQVKHKNLIANLGLAVAGLEPESLDAGYVNDVFKYGGYLALDGENGRSHVVGYVNVRNSGKMERSVFVFTNFAGGSDFFLYQKQKLTLMESTERPRSKYFLQTALHN